MSRIKAALTGALAALTLAGCGLLPDPAGGGEYQVGETVSTAWFDYTVKQVQAADSYEDRAAGQGERLVVAELTLTNTFEQAVPMFDADFQLYWGAEGQEEMVLPLEAFCQAQLPSEYDLDVRESRTGTLVYQVPAEAGNFTLAFLEVFENGTDQGEDGDLFLIRFTLP